MTETTFSSFDYQMMSLALQLAKQGQFTTAPNPNVGCVLTRNDMVVGQGAHLKAGEPHAEVHALLHAGELAKGATAYVTLEPCSHFGRTPPCAAALIKAQVSRVVCAMQDPNPQVAGRGIAMLREAGIHVDVGLLEEDAQALNPGFIQKMKTGKPFVQLKLAASLDGKTALANGESQWITSSAARQDVQGFRAKAGAILSTATTVLADDASLNVRWSELPASIQAQYPEASLRQPLRVILDRQFQLAQSEQSIKFYQADGDYLLVHHQDVHSAEEITLTHHNPSMLLAEKNGQFDLSDLLPQLAEHHNVNHLWVEAGGSLAASMIQQNLVDEIIIYLAPKLMGTDGRGLTQITGLSQMNEALDLVIKDLRMVGKDIRIIATINQQ